MGKLTDILAAGGQSGDDFRNSWNTIHAADECGLLPAGQYICRITSGVLFASHRGTPGYKLTFTVVEGKHAGNMLWHDLWLTPAALPMTKRDLAKLDINDHTQLEQPLPSGICCKVLVALRQEDDGTQRNRVRRFDVVGIDPPETDPFAPNTQPDRSTDGGKGSRSEDQAPNKKGGDNVASKR